MSIPCKMDVVLRHIYGKMWRPRYSQSFVSTKGLRNAPGENNCFLNSAIQVLWHLDIFRRSFRLLSGHVCMDNSCIFCALKVLFTQFQYSDQTSLPPDAMRKALAQTFADQQRFQMGLMDDAAECLENILMRIHSHIAHTESEDMCNAPHCIPHRKFAMTVVEQVVCRCGATSEPLPFTQMVHYVSTRTLVEEWRYMVDNSRERLTDIFDQLLRTANARNDLRDCPSNCGQRVEIRRNLMNKPDVVCVGLVWDSDRPAPSHIMDVLRCIGINLRLSNVFHNAADAFRAKPLSLVGVVCYYGKHYSTFFYNTRLNRWIYFDDDTVREMGANWSCVVDKCCRGHYQPLLLLYANLEADVINADTAPQFTTRIANQTLPTKQPAPGPGAAAQSSAFHRHQRSTVSSGQPSSSSGGNTQRRAITPGPIRSDRDPADDYMLEKRRAITPGPDKNPAAYYDNYDITPSNRYHSDEQLADKQAAHMRQSSYLQAVDFPPPAHPGGAPNYQHVPDYVTLNRYKNVSDEGYYTQRLDHSKWQRDDRQLPDSRTKVSGREIEQRNMHNGFDVLDGSNVMQKNQMIHTDAGNRQAEYPREEKVTGKESIMAQTDNGASGPAKTIQDHKSLPPHKSRLAKAAEIQRKESFKRGNKIPADVIRFDVSDVPTNLAPKGSRNLPQKESHSTIANTATAASRGGPVEICQEAVDWQHSKYKMAESKPSHTSQLPRSKSNYALDYPSSRKHRRERRHTLHSNPVLPDKFDLQNNSSSTVNQEKVNPAKTAPKQGADHQEYAQHRYGGPLPNEHIQQTVNTKPDVIQSNWIKHQTNNKEQKESSPPLPPAYDQTGRTLDSYLLSSSQKPDYVNHTQQPSIDSTHNADQNRKASENLYQHYQMRGLHVKKTQGSGNMSVMPKENINPSTNLYKREMSVPDSGYTSGDRSSSSSNNSLPPAETKESRQAGKQATESNKVPPSYEQTCLAGISKSASAHNVEKFSSSESLSSAQSAHGRSSTVRNVQNISSTAPPPGMESDVHDLCNKAESLMAESLQKEKQNDLAMAMCLCTQAVTYLKQALQLETCSYDSHVYARMKHNTCVLRSRSLHRRIMMRQESNTNSSEASDNISETSLHTNDSSIPVELDSRIPGMKHSVSVPGIYEQNGAIADTNKEKQSQGKEKSPEEPPYVSNLIKSWNSKLSTADERVTSKQATVKPYAHVHIPAKESRTGDPSSAKLVRSNEVRNPGQAKSTVVPDNRFAGFNAGSKYGDFSIKFVDYNGHPVGNDAVTSNQFRTTTSDKSAVGQTSEPIGVNGQYTHTNTINENALHDGRKVIDGTSLVGQKATLCVTSNKEHLFARSSNVADADKRSLEIFGTLPRKRGSHGKQNSMDKQKFLQNHARQNSSLLSKPHHIRENSLDNSLDSRPTGDNGPNRFPKHERDSSSHPHHRRDRSFDGMLQISSNYSPDYGQHSSRSQSRMKDGAAIVGRPSDHRLELVKDSMLGVHSDKHSRETSSERMLQGSHHSRQSSTSSYTSHSTVISNSKPPGSTGQVNSHLTTHNQFPAGVSTNIHSSQQPHHSTVTLPYRDINTTKQYSHQHTEVQNGDPLHNLRGHYGHKELDVDQQVNQRQSTAPHHSYTVNAQKVPYTAYPLPLQTGQASNVYDHNPQTTSTTVASIPMDRQPAAPPQQQQQQQQYNRYNPEAYRTSSSAQPAVTQSYQNKPVPSVAAPSQRHTAAAWSNGPKPVPPVRASSMLNDHSKPLVSQQQSDHNQQQHSVKAVKQQLEQLEQLQIEQFSGENTVAHDKASGMTSGVRNYAEHGNRPLYTGVQTNRQNYDETYKPHQGADLSSNNSNTFRTEGHGKYPVTGSDRNGNSSSNDRQGTAATAVYLGPPQPEEITGPTAAHEKTLPCLRKGRRSEGNLPVNVKPLSKSVKFCEQVVLVGTQDDVPHEQDYFSLVENLLNRRGKALPRNSPMPARKYLPEKTQYGSDAEDNNSDTGSSVSDSNEDNDKVRCNLCRKKHISFTAREMYCDACRHYLARFGQVAAT